MAVMGVYAYLCLKKPAWSTPGEACLVCARRSLRPAPGEACPAYAWAASSISRRMVRTESIWPLRFMAS